MNPQRILEVFLEIGLIEKWSANIDGTFIIKFPINNAREELARIKKNLTADENYKEYTKNIDIKE